VVKPTKTQMRQWGKRAATILTKIEKLQDDMMEDLGVDHRLTDLTDDVLCTAEILVAAMPCDGRLDGAWL